MTPTPAWAPAWRGNTGTNFLPCQSRKLRNLSLLSIMGQGETIYLNYVIPTSLSTNSMTSWTRHFGSLFCFQGAILKGKEPSKAATCKRMLPWSCHHNYLACVRRRILIQQMAQAATVRKRTHVGSTTESVTLTSSLATPGFGSSITRLRYLPRHQEGFAPWPRWP